MNTHFFYAPDMYQSPHAEELNNCATTDFYKFRN